jgi:hypothetical protein
MWVQHGFWFWVWTIGALVAAILMLVVVHFTPNQFKRYLILTLTFLGGLFYVLEFFIPPDPKSEEAAIHLGHALNWNLTKAAAVMGNVTQVIAGFTFLLGVYNLARIHGNILRRGREGWPYSLSFFVSFLLMVVAGFWRDWQSWFDPNKHGHAPPLWIKDTNPLHAAMPHDAYTVLFKGLYLNLESTMFSILAFYIVSAAYRAFRIRSGEAAVLMVVALVLMMGQVPLGMAVTNWIPNHVHGFLGIDWSLLRIENFSQYVLTAVNSPVQRAIGFGLGLGALAMALRIWLSLERGTYFSQED